MVFDWASIAAHLDPDILITDEVLAVVDLEFREKSIKTHAIHLIPVKQLSLSLII